MPSNGRGPWRVSISTVAWVPTSASKSSAGSGGQGLDARLEQFAKLLGRGKAQQNQRIGTKRGRQAANTALLPERGVHQCLRAKMESSVNKDILTGKTPVSERKSELARQSTLSGRGAHQPPAPRATLPVAMPLGPRHRCKDILRRLFFGRYPARFAPKLFRSSRDG